MELKFEDLFPQASEELIKEYGRHTPEKGSSWEQMNPDWLACKLHYQIVENLESHEKVDDLIDMILIAMMLLERKLKLTEKAYSNESTNSGS